MPTDVLKGGHDNNKKSSNNNRMKIAFLHVFHARCCFCDFIIIVLLLLHYTQATLHYIHIHIHIQIQIQTHINMLVFTVSNLRRLSQRIVLGARRLLDN